MVYSVIPAADRAVTTTDWLTSRHSFSFGDHYDPSNTNHGSLLVNNDDVVTPLQGFDQHAHRESEIVTWVTSGALVHQDSEGHSGIVYPGLAQRMSAGTGVLHSERNDTWPDHPGAGTVPVRFVQMWVMPDEFGLTPSYAAADISDELTAGGLVPVASGDPNRDSAIRIANRSATLFAARLDATSSVELPSGRFTHVFVTQGSPTVGEHLLAEGDAVRGGDLGGVRVSAAGDAEILIWVMDRDLRELMG
ncbi:pirin family protein [Gordonia sp. Z-3]|jgi:redox-sensitive bicupin YhaK (pirin superfamily)|uniref:Pirin family protein n=1 Tax=Gordonia tangerina TaxID=2911060 RepID=A0ABS9DJT0_9ACTN|nr:MULTISPECIES: pirin-like bicupin family protein [Gordonia]MAU81378.1 quercetin 2,3-dioxygenase [Gordonia sp. (in: high G+C Gram-positive bacteria)]MCF3938088.1 pirin family protein [Gordonia tangerina]MED5802217.1 pirin family protein [Gordonia sp. Z-3]